MKMMDGQIDNQEDVRTIKDLIFDLEHKLGILQHHDAVSGTEKQHVNSDYNKILTESRDNLMKKFIQYIQIQLQ